MGAQKRNFSLEPCMCKCGVQVHGDTLRMRKTCVRKVHCLHLPSIVRRLNFRQAKNQTMIFFFNCSRQDEDFHDSQSRVDQVFHEATRFHCSRTCVPLTRQRRGRCGSGRTVSPACVWIHAEVKFFQSLKLLTLA